MLSADSDPVVMQADLHLARTLVPLKSMMTSHLRELLSSASVDMLFAGQALFEPGSGDGSLIYLLHGDMELHLSDGRVVLEKGRSRIYPLAAGWRKPVKAVAKTDCAVMRVDRMELDKLLTWSQIAEYLLVDMSYQRDLDEDVEWMMTVLKSNLFFKVPPINAPDIFSRLTPLSVGAGEVILRQGEIGDGCYFIKEGEAVVSRYSGARNGSQPIADITVGRCFGEDALVNKTVRNATVTMRGDGVLMRLGKPDFILLLKEPAVNLIAGSRIESELAAGTLCIDVRTEDEYALGHIRRGVNIPLNLLRLKLRLLEKNTRYLLCCDTGQRSRAAVHLLNRQGFETFALEGGINGLSPQQWRALEDCEQDFLLRDGQVVEGL